MVFFNVVKSNLGLDSGIVLTTGRAASIPGSYGINGFSAYLASNDNGFPGDTSLNTLAGQQTMDICKLEFDFIPSGDSISINYVFSSEEYNTAVCGPYNDAFAFFISGPGISGADNMALVPGTNIPVTINSINNGIPGSSGGTLSNCTSMGSGSPFTAYYIDNSSSSTLTHKGFTTVLKAVHAVTECARYHLKIAIADAGNAKYDSGVFLEAGSLQSGHYRVEALAAIFKDTTGPICVKGCLPGRFRIKAPKVKGMAQTVKFIISGNAVSGVDFAPLATDSVVIPANTLYADIAINGLPTPANGIKQLNMYVLSSNSCTLVTSIVDSASIFLYDTLHITVMPADTVICGNSNVLMKVSGDDIYSYSWSPDYRLTNAAIKTPVASPSISTIYTVTASMPGTSCPFKTAIARFDIKLTPQVILPGDTIVCNYSSFQLSPVVEPANIYYKYSWAGPGSSSNMEHPVFNNVTIQNAGIYHLLITNDTNGCKAAATINIEVNAVKSPEIASPVVICLHTLPVSLYAEGVTVNWYGAAGNILGGVPTPPTDAIAQIHYLVSQTEGKCESAKTEVTVNVKKCCDGNIFIPSAFTPNNDGLNDKFRPLPDYGYFVKDAVIYNRWGQLMYSGNTAIWEGNAGTEAAGAGVYYYKIIFGCILGGEVERIGDVTLIR